MKNLIAATIGLFLSCSITFAQDVKKLLISRNTGTKVLHDGTSIRTFGFSERLSQQPPVPGPLLEFYEGDSIEIDLWNVSQGAPHTIHLHGLDVNQANDGVPHLSFSVEHMTHGYYRFVAPHPGTYLYHCHVASTIHVQAGMYGLVVIHPKSKTNQTWDGGYYYDLDKRFVMSEIDTMWHQDAVLEHDHDTSANFTIPIPKYQPTYFLVNGLSNHQLKDSSQGIFMPQNRVAFMRFANVGFYSNSINFPKDLKAVVVSSDGRPLSSSDTVNQLDIHPGERYGVLLSSTSIVMDSIAIDYVNLNTYRVEGTQYIQVGISKPSVVTEIDKKLSILLYPNPVLCGAPVTIDLDDEVLSVELINSAGMHLPTNWIHAEDAIRLNTPDIPGIYFVAVRTLNGGLIHQRLIAF